MPLLVIVVGRESMRVWEMSLRRWSGLAFTSTAIILGGYGIMLLVTPTEEQLKSVDSPEQLPQHPDFRCH